MPMPPALVNRLLMDDAAAARREADEVTQLLCGVMRILDQHQWAAPPLGALDVPGLREWWAKHRRLDASERRGPGLLQAVKP